MLDYTGEEKSLQGMKALVRAFREKLFTVPVEKDALPIRGCPLPLPTKVHPFPSAHAQREALSYNPLRNKALLPPESWAHPFH